MKIQALQDKSDISTLKTQMSTIKKEILETLYPVNSIYITMDGVNPKTRFGIGEWQLIEDKFLVGAGSKIPDVNMTGGSWSHKHGLSNAYIPLYIGSQFLYYRRKSNVTFTTNVTKDIGVAGQYYDENKDGRYFGVEISGDSDNTETMPPYLSVYIWKRIS